MILCDESHQIRGLTLIPKSQVNRIYMHSILPLSTQRHISDRPTTPLPVDCVRLPRGRSERRKIEQVAAADRHQPHEFQPTTFPTRRRQGSAFGKQNHEPLQNFFGPLDRPADHCRFIRWPSGSSNDNWMAGEECLLSPA